MSLNSGRISISLFNCALLLLQVASLADEPDRNKSANKTSSGQPEAGYIVVSQALVYSGPSDEYYPTQVLKQGAAVEVHSKTDNGWLGIRPPGGSFSWVPAADAYLLPGGKSIEITSKNSVSWIGSSLGTAKQYRWLVRLNVGEQLTRLGEEVIKDKDGKDMLWYKISPPNGEYRWIKSNAVSHEPPAQLVKQTSADPAVRPASAEAQKPAANRSNRTARPPTKKSTSPKSNTVKSAAYARSQDYTDGVVIEGTVDDGFVIDGGTTENDYVEGQYIEGDYTEGEYIDGEVVEGEYVDGEIIYDGMVMDGEYSHEQHEEPDQANWNDWQLFEFTDEGLRFPALERAALWRSKQRDPLAEDPFSLEMPPRKRGHLPPGLPDLTETQPHARRQTPWRDPRILGQKRMLGYPQASGQPGFGSTLSNLQGTMQQTRENLGNAFSASSSSQSQYYDSPGHGQSVFGLPSLGGRISRGAPVPGTGNPIGAGVSEAGNSFPGQPTPRLAPPLDLSGQNAGVGYSGFGNGVSGNLSPMSGTQLGGTADMSNLPNLPINQASGSSWTNRNWFGLNGNSGGSGGPGLLESSSQVIYQLQQKLSEMVTRPTQQWNFSELKERVQYYINNGANPVERGQARLLLERIGEFERHAMLSGPWIANNGGSTTAPVTLASYTGSTNSSATNNAVTSATMSPANFDATGWLVPVHAAQPGQPAYALTSDSGQVVSYLTGLPGMNLERYINQAVGVHGLRGFLPEFQAAHIEAQNITRLR